MEKTTENTAGVIAITDKARIFNNEIGSYQEHFLNERFGYTIRLSNGRIEMSREIAQDYEVQPESISDKRIEKVAQTYRNQ